MDCLSKRNETIKQHNNSIKFNSFDVGINFTGVLRFAQAATHKLALCKVLVLKL
jgi:hypothetical protein